MCATIFDPKDMIGSLKIHERNHTLGTSLINVRLVTKNSSKGLHCEHATVRGVVIEKVSKSKQCHLVQMIDFDLGKLW